tara:strand:- start:38 stop:331 length:294 start_codon:yes stop_codon:yes gene_type:complete
MAREVATTKWCPICHSTQKIKGFRTYRCKECWVAAGKPKVEAVFKAMDKPKPKKAAVKKTTKNKVVKPEEYKPIILIEDRPKKRAKRKKPTKKPTKK